MISRRKVTTYNGFWSDVLKLLFSEECLIGDSINQFRNKLSEYIGAKHIIFTSSGRDAFMLILSSLRLDPGDEIIFPSYTLKNLSELVENAGFKSVFVPISNDFNMNVELIEKFITDRTKIIVATHLFGNPCEIEKIKEIADKHSIFLIEDCAHALGAETHGKKVGSFGSASFFSFETRKIINTIGGGAIATDDEEIYERCMNNIENQKYSRTQLIKKTIFCLFEQIILTPFFWGFIAKMLNNKFMKMIILYLYRAGHSSSRNSSFRYTNIQAFLGIKQLDKIDRLHQKKQWIAKIYNDILDNKVIPIVSKNSKHAFYCYVIRVENAYRISEMLLESGIDTGSGDEVMQVLGDDKATKIIHDSALELPMYKNLKLEEIKKIAGKINELIE